MKRRSSPLGDGHGDEIERERVRACAGVVGCGGAVDRMAGLVSDRLKAYADQHGITWKGSVKQDGEYWRAKLEFSDRNEVYHGTAPTKDQAIERAVDFAIDVRESPPRPVQGNINVRAGR